MLPVCRVTNTCTQRSIIHAWISFNAKCPGSWMSRWRGPSRAWYWVFRRGHSNAAVIARVVSALTIMPAARRRRHRRNASRSDARLSVASTRRPGHAELGGRRRRWHGVLASRLLRGSDLGLGRIAAQHVPTDRYGLQRKNFRMPKRVWRRINMRATEEAYTLQRANWAR